MWNRRAKITETLYVYLGERNKTNRIFVNGKEATHSRIHWPRRLTYTDIAPYVVAGRRNQIVLRVEPGGHGGGILRGPVAIRDVEPPKRIYFDLADQRHAEVFMRGLHTQLVQQG